MASTNERHWLASYPESAPHEVHPKPDATVVSALEFSVCAYADRSGPVQI